MCWHILLPRLINNCSLDHQFINFINVLIVNYFIYYDMQQYYISLRSFWLFIYVMDNLQDMLVYKRPLAVEYYTKTSSFDKIIPHRIMICFVHTTHVCRSSVGYPGKIYPIVSLPPPLLFCLFF